MLDSGLYDVQRLASGKSEALESVLLIIFIAGLSQM